MYSGYGSGSGKSVRGSIHTRFGESDEFGTGLAFVIGWLAVREGGLRLA
jgi:hypothetical protein